MLRGNETQLSEEGLSSGASVAPHELSVIKNELAEDFSPGR
jgi:hypothetical protein